MQAQSRANLVNSSSGPATAPGNPAAFEHRSSQAHSNSAGASPLFPGSRRPSGMQQLTYGQQTTPFYGNSAGIGASVSPQDLDRLRPISSTGSVKFNVQIEFRRSDLAKHCDKELGTHVLLYEENQPLKGECDQTFLLISVLTLLRISHSPRDA